MARKVTLRPGAIGDLKAIFAYVAERGGPERASQYVARIRDACNKVVDFSERGTPRDALRPGLRSIPFERRATIYYLVEPQAVRIVRILHAGMDPGRAFKR